MSNSLIEHAREEISNATEQYQSFLMDTEVLDSGGLSRRVEPVSLKRRIHLPEVRLSSFADGRYDFRAYAFVVAKMVCGDLLDGC